MNELEQLIAEGNHLKATDIIVADAQSNFMRINRKLEPYKNFTIQSPYHLLEQVMEKFDPRTQARYRKNLEEGLDIDCAFSAQSGARVRANIFVSVKGLEFTFRLIPEKRMTAEQIGIPVGMLNLARRQGGMILVTGVSGAGKTTTLAAMLDTLNATEKKHILALEDPIEYIFENRNCVFSQREIYTHSAGYDAALRSAMRENPDVILIGEMRDYKTVRAAVELAETGHLVRSTLHTRNAVSSLDRIISMATVEESNHLRSMIANQILGVLSQTLLKRKQGGLIAAFEFMASTPAIRNLIRENKLQLIYNEISTGRQEGMTTMEESLLRLVERDIIALDDAFKNTSKPEVLKQMLRGSPSVNQLELDAIF